MRTVDLTKILTMEIVLSSSERGIRLSDGDIPRYITSDTCQVSLRSVETRGMKEGWSHSQSPNNLAYENQIGTFKFVETGRSKFDILFLDNYGDCNLPEPVRKRVLPFEIVSVGIDLKSWMVFLVGVDRETLKLMPFAWFPLYLRSTILNGVDPKRPYALDITHDGLLKYLSGDEGWNYLRESVRIVFPIYRDNTKQYIYHHLLSGAIPDDICWAEGTI